MKVKKYVVKALLLLLCIGFVPVVASAEQEYERVVNPTEIHVGYDSDEKLAEDGSVPETWKKGYHFTDKTMDNKMIPIYVNEKGLFCISVGNYGFELYDNCQNKIRTSNVESGRETLYIHNVEKGEVFYCKLDLPEQETSSESVVQMCIISKKGKELGEKDAHFLVGTGKTFYKRFSIEKKSVTRLVLSPLMKVKWNSYTIASIQKKQNGKWKTVVRDMNVGADEHGKTEFDLALDKGEYRLKIKASKKQFVLIGFYTRPIIKVAYREKKATLISKKEKISKEKRYAFFTNDTRAHYFKFKATSKRKYLNVYTDVNAGKLKITVYTKNSSKPIKTLIKQKSWAAEYENNQKYDGYIGDSIRLKKCKGTVYVKVEKVNKNSSGAYKLILSNSKCR